MALPATPAAVPAALGGRESLVGILTSGRFASEGVLLESEAMALLDRAGITTPHRIELADSAAARKLPARPLPGERAVLKLLSPDVPHKTEAGAVRVIEARREAVIAAALEMERRFTNLRVAGFLLCEYVEHETAFGHELLLGMRWTAEFGPVVTLGPGGIHAELLAELLREDEGPAVLAAERARPEDVRAALARPGWARLLTRPVRGQPPPIEPAALEEAVSRFVELARALVPDPIAELEVNPLVARDGALVALDALLRLTRSPAPPPAAPRPLGKVARLLTPRSIAIVGVSEKMNPGRVILKNVLRAGFDPERVSVVKAGVGRIEGCRCAPSLAELPERPDLAVLSLPAGSSAELVAEIAAGDLADAVVLIAGGLEERPGMEGAVARMHEALRRARARPGGGPVVNGGNCLGIRSAPGRCDTLFIPAHKLPSARGLAAPLALVTASGAFAVSKESELAGLRPRYTISVGNQMDLTVSDYLEHLSSDEETRVFAVYLEGFRPLDGARFLRLTRELVRLGRRVIVYRAGRTSAGAEAAASHTAAIAGDHRVCRALLEAAGADVADSLEDFVDLVRLHLLLPGRGAAGSSLGAMSNAGYECVAVADRLGGFRLVPWSEATRARLEAILQAARLQDVVSVRNPLDVTPILGDRGFVATAAAILEDPGVDAAVLGCVPLTPALDTLPAGAGHEEDLRREDGLVAGLVRLRAESQKPWVMVIDAGPLYDPLACALEEGGIPVFRAMDRALRLFGRFCRPRPMREPETEAKAQSTRLATSTTRGRWKRTSSPSGITRR